MKKVKIILCFFIIVSVGGSSVSSAQLQINSDEELSVLIDGALVELQKGNTLFVAEAFRAISTYYVSEIEKINLEKFRESARKGFPQYDEKTVNLLAQGSVHQLAEPYLKDAAKMSHRAGLLFEDLLKWEEALECYKKAIELNPENEDYRKVFDKLNKKMSGK